MPNPDIQAILGFLAQPGSTPWPVAAETWLTLCDESEIEELMDSLCAISPPLAPEHHQYWDWLVDQILSRLASQPAWECTFRTDLFTSLYAHLGATSKSRNQLIQFLTKRAFQEDLQAVVEVITTDPPVDELQVGTALAPLIQNADLEWELIFPALLDGISNPTTAASILDLASFATRNEHLPTHPASDMVQQLNMMLSTIVKQLDVLSETQANPDDMHDVAQQVEQAVALAVSLCDSISLISDESSTPALYQAMGLTHRRVQTEAAAALARLGEADGEAHLIEMASQPISRLRVIQYAQELGIESRLDPSLVTETAIAESQLVLFLSEPTQLGFPPQLLETLESRTCFWPGFDDPITNHLIRFRYEMGEMVYENIGIAGAMTFAISEDLCDLSNDEAYAYFAGMHAEHDDIYELAIDQLTEPQRIDADRCERKIHDAGFESVEPVLLGRLFERTALVAAAKQDGNTGFVIASTEEIQWINQSPSRRPITAYQAYDIYKGTVLLHTFNP
ncbi:MAG: HEAT repeat domain-containing protein [Pirellulaceae bacterium]